MASAGDARSGVRPLAASWLIVIVGHAAGMPSAVRAEGGARVQVTVRPRVEVDGARVKLGDVAVVETSDEALARRISAIDLGPAPRAGAAVTLGRKRLAGWVRARGGRRLGFIVWVGAEATEIRRGGQVIPGARIADLAAAEARQALEARGLRASVKVLRTPDDVPVAAGEVAFAVRPLQADVALAKRTLVWVEVLGPGRSARPVPVHVGLEVFGPGCVTSRAERAGRRLDRELCEAREVLWTGLSAAPLTGGAEGLRLQRPLGPGEVVTMGSVEAVPEVSRGEWARLRVGSGAVEVERRVEVLEDGAVGQTVRVKLPGGAGAILARVSGAGAVEVLQ